jgi:carbon monoxide dehydrogenase subunit G
MHYDGSFEVVSARAEVYEFATDPSKVAMIFPDVLDVKVDDAEHFTLKAKVGISSIKGVMDVKCAIVEKVPSTSVKLKLRASGLSSAVEMESGFSFEDAKGGGTLVKWTADAKVAGLIARVGSRLTDSIAAKYLDQTVEALKRSLS